jgi:hypothetical protein
VAEYSIEKLQDMSVFVFNARRSGFFVVDFTSGKLAPGENILQGCGIEKKYV